MEFENITKEIIGSAIEVHKVLGPGLLESSYKECMIYELGKRGLNIVKEKPVPVIFKEIKLECGYRIDLLVENKVIVELKAIEAIHPVHEAQLLTYMKFAKIKVGLLINFHVLVLKDGLRRFVL